MALKGSAVRIRLAPLLHTVRHFRQCESIGLDPTVAMQQAASLWLEEASLDVKLGDVQR